MLTFGNKILLQDAETGVFHKMECIHKVAGCFAHSLLDFCIPTCVYRRKSVSCMLLSLVELELKGAAKVSKGLLVSLS